MHLAFFLIQSVVFFMGYGLGTNYKVLIFLPHTRAECVEGSKDEPKHHQKIFGCGIIHLIVVTYQGG